MLKRESNDELIQQSKKERKKERIRKSVAIIPILNSLAPLKDIGQLIP